VQPSRHNSAQRRIATWDGPALEVRETQRLGRGVFAVHFIAAGARILTLEGQRFRTADIPPDAFAMQVDEDVWLCSAGESLDDCVNHGCDPNTGFTRQEPVLYALRDISAGEELTWDYSTSIAEKGWSLQCLCGSICCRGVILPFGELTPHERERLRPIALRYLQ
jgi:SET domain